ncbi:alpha/beta-hydrolase [Punctularia strigosozonata HHB-11173 SS5]|uniref:alpha/beta-hydrolase n=1 Tax=Punctularia strigosozonata (strain HHB-11173) TaxID=741275 RepID=UPI0004418391|nr:alpha/beta-hydrolase [Punctularia strigosozonata HHB-11173 SS5]EIN11150.1 alpha/beta-hydrolase [Punctularia strigosozonata HHB-11173 SS5]
MRLATTFIALPLLFAGVMVGAASPASLSSSLTFLYQNDLDWPTAPDHSGAILLEPRNNRAAVSSCEALGETLLVPNGTFFKSDVNSLLSYLNFEGLFPTSQEFWIATKSGGGSCQTISKGADIRDTSCERVLPALCSQSAPFRPSGDQDKDPRFELTISAQDLTVTGYRDHLSFRFLGLPYGNPPERFTYSTLFSGAQKVFNATNFGSQCVQTGGGGSEDCLFLNIFTPFVPGPGTPKSALKPVMFHIHGGSFTSGSANDATFDGGNLASRGDVVVVDINYRLSTLGFLALEDGVTNGNFGIADMTVALAWVQKYITSFGGDPDRVTIFGQSAGAAAVRALLASPEAIGNFSAAIPMSNLAGENFATSFSLYFTISQLQPVAVDPILTETGCNRTDLADVLACLRSVDAETLVNLPDVARFIVIDGKFVTSEQLPVDGSSPVAHVPVVMGFMRDDGAAFIGFPPNSDVTTNIAGVLSSPSAADVEASGLFPTPAGPNSTLDVFNVTARITTDVEFRCLDQAAAISALNHSVFPDIWFYQFNKSYQTPGFDPNAPVCDAPIDAAHPHGDPSQEYFKCHSGELFFVWGNLGQFQLPFRDENDLLFSQLASDTWTSFARTHDPNPSHAFLTARGYTGTLALVKEGGIWEPLGGQNERALRLLDMPLRMSTFEEVAQCDFLGLPFDTFG